MFTNKGRRGVEWVADRRLRAPGLERYRWLQWGVLAAGVAAGGCGDESTPARTGVEVCPNPEHVGAAPAEGQFAVRQVVAGLDRSCAVGSDGGVYCWSVEQPNPERVAGISGASEAALAPAGLCTLSRAGSVTCLDDAADSASVPGICAARGLVVGRDARCVVTPQGKAACWGNLQEGSFAPSAPGGPAELLGVSDVQSVALTGMGYGCALRSDGTVTCWGGGPREADRPGPEPEQVPEISGAIALASSLRDRNMCAVLDSGRVTCWDYGSAPREVPDLDDVVSLSVSDGHACAVVNDGTLRCWGSNGSGQLGDGTQVDSETPVVVSGLEGVEQVSVASNSSGLGTTCALLADGSIACWGRNAARNPEVEILMDVSTPTPVTFPATGKN